MNAHLCAKYTRAVRMRANDTRVGARVFDLVCPAICVNIIGVTLIIYKWTFTLPVPSQFIMFCSDIFEWWFINNYSQGKKLHKVYIIYQFVCHRNITKLI